MRSRSDPGNASLDHFADPLCDLSVRLSPPFRQRDPDVPVGTILEHNEIVGPHPIEVPREDVVVHIRTDLEMRPKHRTVRLPEAIEDPRDDVQVGAIHVGHLSPRQDPPQLCLDRRSTFLPAPAVPVILILDLADPRPDEPEATGRESGAHHSQQGAPFPG